MTSQENHIKASLYSKHHDLQMGLKLTKFLLLAFFYDYPKILC